MGEVRRGWGEVEGRAGEDPASGPFQNRSQPPELPCDSQLRGPASPRAAPSGEPRPFVRRVARLVP